MYKSKAGHEEGAMVRADRKCEAYVEMAVQLQIFCVQFHRWKFRPKLCFCQSV